MATSKRKTARGIHPNEGVRAAYKQAMEKLIAEMANSFEYWVGAAYKANPSRLELAADALPSAELAKRVSEVGKRWIKKFDDMSADIAAKFVAAGRKTTDNAFQSALKDAGWAVKFQVTPVVRDAMNAVVVENVALIKSIPRQYLADVEGIVMRGFTQGRDLAAISEDLQKRHGVTARRAANIARDQSNKLTATVTKARRTELGLFEAEWQHSGGGKEPRHSHVQAGKDKRRFDVRKGCLIDGVYIQPGELINCRCTSRTVLPF